MNFLAHAYLSFEHPQILAGNMVSDFVKGRKKNDFPLDVRQGIQLHRDIDNYTDSHETTRTAKEFFRKEYRLYSGAIVDVLYDHFLANDPGSFSENSLFRFTQRTYATIESQASIFPPNFLAVFYRMQEHNWLFNYRTMEGLGRSLKGLVYRASYISDSLPAYNIIVENKEALRDCFNSFFPSVKQYANERFKELIG